ncbi:MAG: HAD-IIA family hydrolase [Candidatus Peribacteraceae bacterium]|nr:HAD-IIA family hydrolase [Candidatus Peribacteraceae bacterium]MDD5740305.1 HAD-IIA family hydrolase [Candidatus Peribacteraceae bacterium]
MKAIILAAGQGTRLRPLTDDIPKALVEVHGKPILGWQIDALLQHHVTSIVLCTGYRSECIVEYCTRRYPDVAFSFEKNEKFQTTNNAYSLYCARKHLDEDVLLMNGDVVFDGQIIGGLLAETDESLFAVDVGRSIGESMKVTLDLSGRINGIAKTIGCDAAYGCSIDVYKFLKCDAQVIAQTLTEKMEHDEKRWGNQWTEVFLHDLCMRKAMLARPHDIAGLRWWEVDDHEDLRIAQMIFHPGIADLGEKKCYFLDGDGTLYTGNTLIPGAREFWGALTSLGREIYVVSNNTSKTPPDYVHKFLSFGLPMDEDHILLPMDALVAFLQKEGISRIYPLATARVTERMQQRGFVVDARSPQAIITTYDTELTYEKLRTAAAHLHTGVRYFATHADLVCPTEFGPVPDIGTLTTMLEMTTGRRPERIFGKPSPEMILPTLEKKHVAPSEAVTIGDRLSTDIGLGKASGTLSILVLSGEATEDDVRNSEVKPDILTRNVGCLVPSLM